MIGGDARHCLALQLEAAEQIDGNQNQPQRREVHAAIGDGIFDRQDAGGGGEQSEENEIAIAGERKAAAVVPGKCGERKQAGECEDGALIEQRARDGEIPIGIQIDREQEIEDVGEDARGTR